MSRTKSRESEYCTASIEIIGTYRDTVGKTQTFHCAKEAGHTGTHRISSELNLADIVTDGGAWNLEWPIDAFKPNELFPKCPAVLMPTTSANRHSVRLQLRCTEATGHTDNHLLHGQARTTREGQTVTWRLAWKEHQK